MNIYLTSYIYFITSIVPGIILSTNSIPSRWSTSCDIACASNPFPFNLYSFPSLSSAFTVTSDGLITFAN